MIHVFFFEINGWLFAPWIAVIFFLFHLPFRYLLKICKLSVQINCLPSEALYASKIGGYKY